MIGEIGALGGSLIPNLMGESKQFTGSFAIGFIIYTVMAAFVLIVLMLMQRKWTQTWIGKGGIALISPETELSHITVLNNT